MAGRADPDGLRAVEVGAMNVVSGRRTGERVLAGTRRPDALCCANGLLAFGVLQVMVRALVRVPGELAIVGCDDIDFAAVCRSVLTCVNAGGTRPSSRGVLPRARGRGKSNRRSR